MTGRRRDKGKPLGAIATAQRSWDNFERQYSAAATLGHQVHAAALYVQAVLDRVEPELAKRAAAETVEWLVAKAQRLDATNVALTVTTHSKRNQDRNGHRNGSKPH